MDKWIRKNQGPYQVQGSAWNEIKKEMKEVLGTQRNGEVAEEPTLLWYMGSGRRSLPMGTGCLPGKEALQSTCERFEVRAAVWEAASNLSSLVSFKYCFSKGCCSVVH